MSNKRMGFLEAKRPAQAQQQSSTPLLISAEGLLLLAPYIRQSMARGMLVAVTAVKLYQCQEFFSASAELPCSFTIVKRLFQPAHYRRAYRKRYKHHLEQ